MDPRDVFGDPFAVEPHPTTRESKLTDLSLTGQVALVTTGPHKGERVTLQAPITEEFGCFSWSAFLASGNIVVIPAQDLQVDW